MDPVHCWSNRSCLPYAADNVVDVLCVFTIINMLYYYRNFWLYEFLWIGQTCHFSFKDAIQWSFMIYFWLSQGGGGMWHGCVCVYFSVCLPACHRRHFTKLIRSSRLINKGYHLCFKSKGINGDKPFYEMKNLIFALFSCWHLKKIILQN